MEKYKKSIEEFNKYKSQTATAELISKNKDSVKVRFTGHFCKSCGFYDYFDDLKFNLEDNGINTEIKKVKEIENGAEVTFKIIS